MNELEEMNRGCLNGDERAASVYLQPVAKKIHHRAA